jgi:hypothetical protein
MRSLETLSVSAATGAVGPAPVTQYHRRGAPPSYRSPATGHRTSRVGKSRSAQSGIRVAIVQGTGPGPRHWMVNRRRVMPRQFYARPQGRRRPPAGGLVSADPPLMLQSISAPRCVLLVRSGFSRELVERTGIRHIDLAHLLEPPADARYLPFEGGSPDRCALGRTCGDRKGSRVVQCAYRVWAVGARTGHEQSGWTPRTPVAAGASSPR